MSSLSKNRHAGFLLGLALGGGAGVTAGYLLSLRLEPDVARYREVRDYARRAFVRDLSEDEILDKALHGLADGLDDYSQYYSPREAAQLDRETGGRYSGLGVVMRRPGRDGRVLFPLPNSPALAAGVRVGDRFVRVDGKEFAALGEDGFKALISSPEPRDIALVVEGLDGVTRDIGVRTGSVLEPTVKQERIADAARGIGYVAITSFSHETPGEFFAAFERLRGDGMRALVLDLRGNPGGVLVAAVEIARRFVPEGSIVSTEGRGDPIVHMADKGSAWWAGFPLVVLVDDGSASASEVLAAALQDHRAAVVVGSPTYGKGMVQTIHRFDDTGSVFKVTSSYYYTPSHKNLEHSADPTKERGLQPDLRVDVGAEEKRGIHERSVQPSPPRDARAAIEAWERDTKITLLEPPVVDAQLAAAIELLSGKRPGPHATRETP